MTADFIDQNVQAGIFHGRARWDNDAFFRQPVTHFISHDVSALVGLRGGARTEWADFDVVLGREKRFNYLYQNPSATFEAEYAVDVTNWFRRFSGCPVDPRLRAGPLAANPARSYKSTAEAVE